MIVETSAGPIHKISVILKMQVPAKIRITGITNYQDLCEIPTNIGKYQ